MLTSHACLTIRGPLPPGWHSPARHNQPVPFRADVHQGRPVGPNMLDPTHAHTVKRPLAEPVAPICAGSLSSSFVFALRRMRWLSIEGDAGAATAVGAAVDVAEGGRSDEQRGASDGVRPRRLVGGLTLLGLQVLAGLPCGAEGRQPPLRRRWRGCIAAGGRSTRAIFAAAELEHRRPGAAQLCKLPRNSRV